MRVNRTIVIGVVVIAMGVAALAGEATEGFIDGMTIEPAGWMKTTEGIEMGVDHYGVDWTLSRQVLNAVEPKKVISSESPRRWSLVGAFAGFDFTETITATAANQVHYHAAVRSPSGVQTSQLPFVITLPIKLYQGKEIECDGKKIALPRDNGKEYLFQSDSAKTLVIPTESGQLVIRHGKGIIVQDLRKYGDIYQWYSIRLLFSPESGILREGSIDLDIELQPYKTEPISLAGQANMGFTDEVAADGKGGWTDQGPTNDIGMLPVGPRRLGGVLFDILDPKTNGGKSCLIFSGPERPGFLKSVSIPVSKKTFAYLYFLHAIAWAPKEFVTVGQVRVDYADGSKQTIDVQFDRDVSNWWNVLPTENGDTVWTATNGSAAIGLYLARFPVQPKPITQLTLEGTGKAVWMIAGISGGEAVPRLFVPNPVYTVEGDTWTPYTYELAVKPGSIMDFSFMNHAPAGKFGRIIATKDGHFAYADAPDKPIRFQGADLCFSANFQPKDACERLAENMARMGYNTARFHHFDCGVGTSSKDVELNPTEIDKLDYLFYCLKQKGIYITIDLFTVRLIPGGVIDEAPGSINQEFKALIPISESAMKNWRNYTRNLLTHVNPYTKLAWKDDPALFAICVDNEDNLTFWWDEWPSIKHLYDRKFEAWLKEKNLTAGDAKTREVLFNQFLTELQLNAYFRCRDFIRSLGCQALLTDVNFQNDSTLTLTVRPHLDYVDNHQYCATPDPIHRYESLPVKSSQTNNLTEKATIARGVFSSRVFGKPYTITEYSMPFPNAYRAQLGMTMGAYAGLQDWDGLYRFAYAHTAGNTQRVGLTAWMELTQDPISMVTERIGILLFRRGDVQRAKHSVPMAMTREEIENHLDSPILGKLYSDLGLRYRVGQWDIVNAGAAEPDTVLCAFGLAKSAPVKGVPYQEISEKSLAKVLKEGSTSPGAIVSDTGEIEISPTAGQMKVVTGRTECFALEKNKSLAGKTVEVENHGDFCVVAVSSMDEGKSITDARRLLVLHMTDSTNSAARFFDEERTITEEWGTLPHLVRRGSAVVKLRLNTNQTVRAWAITMSGERKNEIPVRRQGDAFEFTVDTSQPTGGCMTYEILLEPASSSDK